jgi:hypothetical protein
MRRWLIVAVAAGVPAAIVLLYCVPPGEGAPYPPCYLYALTGLHCPGCGATRCLHALLHGDLAQAAAYNGLFLLALPFLIVWGFRTAVRKLSGQVRPARDLPVWAAVVISLVLLLYAVLRNLPFHPFDLLAPHVL